MSFRFKQRIKIAPGVYVNIGKKGISTSVGIKGATINLGQNGVKGTVGLPGTGMSYSKKLSSNGSGVQKPSNHAVYQPENENESFNAFVENTKNEAFLMFCSYLKDNGVDLDNVDTTVDTSELVHDKVKDKELEKLMNTLSSTIEEIKYSGASGQREKNRMSKDLFSIKNWLDDNFPNWKHERDLIKKEGEKIFQEELIEKQLLHERNEKERIKKERKIQMFNLVFILLIVIFIYNIWK